MGVRIGSLIIGSLYWDPECNRARWRRERLDLPASRNVFAPIRYGRRSGKRGNSYTMVFSEALTKRAVHLGRAVAIPFIRPVHSVQALVEEAEHLWAAERKSDSFNGSISANWGCVALALNPSRCVPQELVDGWSDRAAQEVGYGRLCRAKDEGEILNAGGLLMIPWPHRTDGLPLELDALLATATDPTIVDGRYPSAQEIASAWKPSTGDAYVEYFWRNRGGGITTFQDDEIEKHLNDRRSA
jgi:hypothetical protein